jgi:LysR family glycine cleavage system transcriptional activator
MNFTYQQVQAAIAGQGLALARLPLVQESLARGELVEPFGSEGRVSSPFAYWLVRWPARRERPALLAFEQWLMEQARATEEFISRAVVSMRPPALNSAR